MRRIMLLGSQIALLLFILLAPGVTLAQGPEPPSGIPTPAFHPPFPLPPIRPTPLPPVEVKYIRVAVDIKDHIATTQVDQVFYNPADVPLEGTFLFPFAKGVSVSSLVMHVDGKVMEGELLSKEEARRLYEEIVRSRRDPALLEYIGNDAFQLNVFPIPPKGERRVQLKYSQLLEAERGLASYSYPLNLPAFAHLVVNEVAVSVNIASRVPIKAVYSPSHPVSISRPDDFKAHISFEGSKVTLDRDFRLFYSVSESELGLTLLTYRRPGEPGYYLLLVSPQVKVEPGQIVPKDLLLVLDVSGSMTGQKLEEAKAALRYILGNLGKEDRFNILAFSSFVQPFQRGLATAAQRQDALKFIDSLQAQGGTNIGAALEEAVAMVSGERPTIIIFLTDGLPTVGVMDPAQILKESKAKGRPGTRIFTFGVGFDVNTMLLDSVAQEFGGASQYVKPGENLEEALSSFYGKVAAPVLTDLRLDYGKVQVLDVYPPRLPDLFLGNQLVIAGRYRSPEERVTITLRGMADGRERVFEYAGNAFPEEARDDTSLPRLWASRKIGFLLQEIRLKGQDRELVEEVIGLSKQYGIATPYTSFFVPEPGPVPLGRPGPMGTPVPMPASGRAAVEQSQTITSYSSATVAPTAPTGPQVRVAVDKTFVLRDRVWVDAAYVEGRPTIQVPFGSPEYFRLAERYPWARSYLAVAERVIVVLDGTPYEVTELEASAYKEIEPGMQDTPLPVEGSDGPSADSRAGPGPVSLWSRVLSILASVGRWFRGLTG
ncbi:MAG: VWA domain-containing protein [Chloroflexi bacterium]|nr:VWA domain-containing protein [Chloroflexota bacterium]